MLQRTVGFGKDFSLLAVSAGAVDHGDPDLVEWVGAIASEEIRRGACVTLECRSWYNYGEKCDFFKFSIVIVEKRLIIIDCYCFVPRCSVTLAPPP